MDGGSNSSRSDDLAQRLMLSLATSAPCCVFFIINGSILFLLHSRPAFSQCPRYALLFNLVLADTVLIAQAQVLFLLVMFQVWISFPLCVTLAMVAHLTDQISPLTLVLMSLERGVAVCFPFRHCALVTLRNTFVAVFFMWSVASVNILAQVVLLLEFPSGARPGVRAEVICRMMNLHAGETIYTYLLFAVSALVICGSFVAVTAVACSASGDKERAEKTRNTLLLHLFQLGLNLVSVMNMELFVLALQCCGKWLLDVVYVTVVLLPRCLSALTYGLRDPALRPALGAHLCCVLRHRKAQRPGRVNQKSSSDTGAQ